MIRAPITSVLILIEMTSGYSLILPLMIANMSASALARSLRTTPIYEALLEQDGVRLHAPEPDAIDAMPPSQLPALDRDFVAFSPPCPPARCSRARPRPAARSCSRCSIRAKR